MDGIMLLRKVKEMLPPLPIIVISDVPDTKRAVEAMKLGAHDFLVKPFDQNGFVNTVTSALSATTHVFMSNVDSLTKTEQAILKLILQSKSTKEIARIRSRSTRTIEDHRQSIMQKLGARDIIGLLKRVGNVTLPRFLVDT
jgi:DNA-binding NarL/FixJ family response regulator